jgi:hypothetical protein
MNNFELRTSNFEFRRSGVAWAIAVVCAVAFAASASAPADLHAMNGAVVSADPSDGGQRGGGAGGGGAQGGGQGGGQGRATGPRPYAEVITSAAKTSEGIFKVHRITEGSRDQLFYEIPKAELNMTTSGTRS